mgnify:CR=1 FL=1
MRVCGQTKPLFHLALCVLPALCCAAGGGGEADDPGGVRGGAGREACRQAGGPLLVVGGEPCCPRCRRRQLQTVAVAAAAVFLGCCSCCRTTPPLLWLTRLSPHPVLLLPAGLNQQREAAFKADEKQFSGMKTFEKVRAAARCAALWHAVHAARACGPAFASGCVFVTPRGLLLHLCYTLLLGALGDGGATSSPPLVGAQPHVSCLHCRLWRTWAWT